MQSSTDYSLFCCDCNEKCTTKEELKVHLMMVHLSNWTPYECAKCPAMRMASVDALKAHQKMCHPDWREKSVIYYYDDDKEEGLKEMFERSLEAEPNKSATSSNDVIPFALRSTSPCKSPLRNTSLPCSSVEVDSETPTTSSAIKIETAEPETTKQLAPQVKRRRVCFVCSMCHSVFANRETMAHHKCGKNKTAFVTPSSSSPPLFIPSSNLPAIRITSDGVGLAGSKPQTDMKQGEDDDGKTSNEIRQNDGGTEKKWWHQKRWYHGRKKWWHGYEYHCNGEQRNGSQSTWSWRCCERWRLDCRATLRTDTKRGGNETATIEHNHPPQDRQDVIQAKLVVEQMKTEAIETDKSARRIITEGFATLTEDQKMLLPEDCNLMRLLYRTRKKAQTDVESSKT